MMFSAGESAATHCLADFQRDMRHNIHIDISGPHLATRPLAFQPEAN